MLLERERFTSPSGLIVFCVVDSRPGWPLFRDAALYLGRVKGAPVLL